MEHGAAGGQRQQEQTRRQPVIAGEAQHQRRANHRERVVHEQGRGNPAREQHCQHQPVGAADPAQQPGARARQQTAVDQRVPQNEDAEQEADDLPVDGAERRVPGDASGQKDRQGTREHDLPDVEAHRSQPSECDQDQDSRQRPERQVHTPDSANRFSTFSGCSSRG